MSLSRWLIGPYPTGRRASYETFGTAYSGASHPTLSYQIRQRFRFQGIDGKVNTRCPGRADSRPESARALRVVSGPTCPGPKDPSPPGPLSLEEDPSSLKSLECVLSAECYRPHLGRGFSSRKQARSFRSCSASRSSRPDC